MWWIKGQVAEMFSESPHTLLLLLGITEGVAIGLTLK